MVYITYCERKKNRRDDMNRRRKYYVKKYKRLHQLKKTLYGRNTKHSLQHINILIE